MKNKERSLFLRIFDIRMFLYDFGRVTASLFIWLWARTKRIFINDKKPRGFARGRYIIATNHVSSSDHFVIATAVPSRRICFVSTDNLTNGKYGWFFKAIGTIGINKNKPSMKALRQVQDTLNRGHVVCMFPEGTLNQDEEMKEFKGGIAMMAAISEADILPVYQVRRNKGQRKIVVVGEKLKYQDLFKSNKPTKEEINRVSELLMQKEKELEIKYKELIS